jgi:predicted metal-binding membrane protein
MTPSLTLQALLRRDRAIVLAALVGISAVAWLDMVLMARGLPCAACLGMAMEMAQPHLQPWTPGYFAMTLAMWAEMMVAMMVPTVAPMVLLFATVNRQRHADHRPFVPTGFFLLGYVVVWTGFSLAATVTQWGLHDAALLSPAMASTSRLLSGLVLIAAGAFQWTPWKNACLKHCRSSLSFIMTEWREGRRGAFLMGLRHGNYCLGCCWLLMLLLFVAGVMNLLWIALLTAFVLAEKIAPGPKWITRTAGAGLAVWGGCLIALR